MNMDVVSYLCSELLHQSHLRSLWPRYRACWSVCIYLFQDTVCDWDDIELLFLPDLKKRSWKWLTCDVQLVMQQISCNHFRFMIVAVKMFLHTYISSKRMQRNAKRAMWQLILISIHTKLLWVILMFLTELFKWKIALCLLFLLLFVRSKGDNVFYHL